MQIDVHNAKVCVALDRDRVECSNCTYTLVDTEYECSVKRTPPYMAKKEEYSYCL